MSLKDTIKHFKKNEIRKKLPKEEMQRLSSNYEYSVGDTSEFQINDVFNRSDFKKHIKLTAKELNMDEELVEKVIKQYVTSVIMFMNKIHEYKVRITVYTLFNIEFNNYFYRPDSKIHFAHNYRKWGKTILPKILKFIKTNYLNKQSYEQPISKFPEPKPRISTTKSTGSTES